MDETSCRTVAIEVGLQNGGMATALAIGTLKDPLAALGPAIFGPWMNISGSILASWWAARPPEMEAAGAITLQGSFLYSNDGETIGVITNFYQAVNAEAKGITRTTQPAWSTENIQRVLVYGGKTGTKIRLAYREVWKNITRPSHDVFTEFDLADSKVVEIEGARVEVAEATNESIQYRILRAFDAE